MLRYLGTGLRVTIVSVIVFGFLYPFVVTGLVHITFPREADGAYVSSGGKIVGSDIIGQLWSKPYYFHGRPSAAGKGYDPTSTGGTNFGPGSKKLIDATKATIAALRKENPDAAGSPPMDLVTSSGSGIDPDISPESAYYQAPRVATARHVPLDAVRKIIADKIKGRTWGILGEPRVNVLALNLALDTLMPLPASKH